MLRAGQTMAGFERQLVAANPRLAQFAQNGQSVIRTMNNMEGSSKSFLSTMRDLSIVTGLVSMGLSAATRVANGWVGEIVKVNAEMERMRFQMQAMSTASDPIKDAGNNVRYLREQATQMPFSLQAIQGAFTKLKATGIDPTQGSLKAIADGIAAFGGTDDQLQRVTVALTQMSGKSVIQMEELRQQLGEHMPSAMQVMARSMGVSVAELTKAISTGTVSARGNLERFYAELERSYGGSAQRMMQTFSGQVALLKTSLQNLATDTAGNAFFEKVKSQLGDINAFLGSDLAKGIATSIGNALGSAVGYIRNAVEAIWNFRNQLMDLAIIAGSGAGLMLFGKAVTGVASSVLAATVSMRAMFLAISTGRRDIALGLSGLTAMSTATTGLGVAAIGARTALSGIAVGLAGAAPILTVLVGALYLVADGFGLLSNKTKEAYDELVKYGAESRKQARETIGARERQLRDRISQLEALGAYGDRRGSTGGKSLEVARKELADLESRKAELIAGAGEREDQNALAKVRQRLDDTLALERSKYAKSQNDQQVANEKELATAEETGKSRKRLEEENRAVLLKNQLDFYGTQLRIIKEEEAKLLQEFANADEDKKLQIAKTLNYVTERSQAAAEELARAQKNGGNFGIDTLTAPKSDKEKIEDAKRDLQSLQTEVSGLEAAFNGGSSALAQLQFKLARGDYGSITDAGEATKKLYEGLLAATQQKEALDKLLKGKQKLEADVERNRLKILEEQMELEERRAGRQLTEAEKIKLRKDNGFYDGFGTTDKAKAEVEKLTSALGDQGVQLTNVGNIAKQQTFGEETVRRIQTVIDAMRTLAGAVSQVGTNLAGVNFGNFGGDLATAISGGITPVMQNLPADVTARMKQAMEHLMSKGWSREAASGIVGNLHGESRLNPNARAKGDGRDGSDSIGIGQWNSDRARNLMAFAGRQGKNWNDFTTQLDFIDWELRNTEGKAGSRLRMAPNSAVASDVFMREYERPSAASIAKSGGARAGAAQQAYNLVDGRPGPVPAAAPTTGSAALQLLPLPELRETVTLKKELAKTDKSIEETLKGQNEQEKKLQVDRAALDRIDAEKKLQAEIKATAETRKRAGKENPAGVQGANYEKVVADIGAGKYGAETNAKAAEYKNLIDLAMQLDGIEKETGETKKLTTQTDREKKKLDEERVELNRRIAEQQKKAADPNYKPDSSALQQLRTDLDAYTARIKELYGADSEAYRQSLAYKSSMLQQQGTLDLSTQMAKFAEERVANENSLLTQTEIRRREAEKQIAIIDGAIQKARENGTLEVGMVEQAEQAKAAIRAKYAQESSPMSKQFKEWGDLQGNLSKQSAQWMDSLADGLTGVIMGTTDLKTAAKQLISGILKDIINSGIKKMMADMMGAKNGAGAGGGKKGGVAGAARTAASAGSKKMGGTGGLYHTGGIIGGTPPMTRGGISPSVFAGARKFHTGGLITGRNLPGLMPSEVPIIAQKGEGVFTPEQMANMGGFAQSNFQINAPITVNGSSGTPEQNDDLARKMAKEMETSMRSIVADEYRRQSRPGNFANTRSR
jgi:tape measure domain-containing protein